MGIGRSKCNSITEKEIMKYDPTETWIVCTSEYIEKKDKQTSESLAN